MLMHAQDSEFNIHNKEVKHDKRTNLEPSEID